MADKQKSKRDELKIIGNGAAERARQAIKKDKDRKRSRLDEIMGASRAALGIKKTGGKKK